MTALGRIAVASLLSVTPLLVQVAAAPDTRPARTSARNPINLLTEHRYRIIGKVRLAFFWVGRDDVGSARLTWRADDAGRTLSLLIGSNPERAPRGLNEWGYLREEVSPDEAEARVFLVRSLDKSDMPPSEANTFQGDAFGATCASATGGDVSTSTTSIKANGLTYRMFDRLLERVVMAPSWTGQHTVRPADADPGFLTALQRVINVDPAQDGTATAAQPVTYVYNSTLYNLRLKGSRELGKTVVGTRSFESLRRVDLVLQNQKTQELTRFGVTFVPSHDGTALPVQFFYQPSFWLSVELRLDDQVEVPADPATDAEILEKIRTLCATVGR